MSRFEFTDEDGGRFVAKPLPGVPYVLLASTTPDGAAVPLDRLEEVIAGLRDIARQAGAQAALDALCGYCGVPKHSHRALHPWTSSDNTHAALPGAPITDEQYAHAAAVLPPGAGIAAEAIRQAARSTQDDFGLATGGPGPNAEGAGA